MYLLFKKFYIVFLLMCTLPSAAVKYINPVSPRFPVLAWYSIYPDSEQTTTRYKELADCGFNISFTHFRNRHSLAKGLKACSGTGVKIMVMCGDELENNTSEVVKQFKNNPNVCGWFLYDEPTCDDFKSLRAFRDRILAVDKKHQLYLNLYPLCFADALKAKTYRDYVERFAKEVDLVVFEIAKTKPCHSINYRGETFVFFLNGIAKAVGGSIEVGKEAFDICFGGVAIGRTFNS